MRTHTSPPERALAAGGDVRLPTPPGVVRRFWTRHPHLADTLIALIYVVPMALTLLVNLLDAEPAPLRDILPNAAIMLLLAAALFCRRRMPRLGLALTWVSLLTFADYGEAHLVAQLLALYAVAVYSDVRSAWIGFGASTVLTSLAAWHTVNPAEVPWIPVAIQVAIMMFAATLVGVNMGNSKRYVASLLELAAQLTRERDQQAQFSRISERSRIAAEMHDVVAHSLSVMVALADGAHAIAAKDIGRSRAAMLDVAVTGRRSMTEMRRLLGVLDVGTAPVPLAPQPGIDQLADLVESFRSTGLPVVLERSGREPTNPSVQLTIFRLVQESLTNVLRYADTPTRVVVRLNSAPGRAEVTVSDNGRLRREPSAHAFGRGLIGMQERVSIYGGTFEAGAGLHDGWRVHAAMTFENEPRQPAVDEER
ncbi:MAG: histidine kinase [Cryobacterium sp.]|uniref:sensor histidine kinase n=1 Tax=unclassified Cryobacterium TaxID=2649013 RepID=UPI0018C9C83F|nr:MULTISPECIES: histidine kinase [unclassified Cryobacterium]MCY7404837.1 histidine kinase [Cryobacterium sp.]MEC5154824.1 signal transduction histidine kinase [Cryobacterium sp. CAN_C3]